VRLALIADYSTTMRLPFRIALAFCGLLALLVNFWLLVGLVLIFGRAVLAGAHRRGPAGGHRNVADGAAGRAQEKLPGEAGETATATPSVFEILPFP
jgi:hypothetical protein